jgi:DNA-binding MarR family transcriptional regulator
MARAVSAARTAAMEDAALQLRRVMFAMRNRFAGALRAAGLTFPQWVVIKALRKKSRLTTREVAEALDCTPANATGIIDRLERDSFVDRTRSEDDRRVVFIELTPRGKAKFDEVVGLAPGALEDMFEGWTAKDFAQFQEALSRLNLAPEEKADF